MSDASRQPDGQSQHQVRSAPTAPGEPPSAMGVDARARILKDRAVRLGSRRSGGRSTERSSGMLVFLLDDRRRALPLRDLLCVVRARPLCPFPGASATLLGVLYERAAVWAVHDLRRLLDEPAAGPAPGAYLLLRDERRRVGIAVTSTDRVQHIAADQLSAAPDGRSPPADRVLTGVTEDGVVVVDAQALLRLPALSEAL